MTYEELMDAWNAQADAYNKWVELDDWEKMMWAMQMEREACAKVCEEHETPRSDNYADLCAAAIRARSKE